MEQPNFDDNVPIPIHGRGRRPRYKWLQNLKIGQSFICSERNARVIMTLCHRVNYLPEGFRLTSSKTDNNKRRIWRIA